MFNFIATLLELELVGVLKRGLWIFVRGEFHMVAYVDWKTGKLKEGLTKIVEKPTRGVVGQIKFYQCLFPGFQRVSQ